MDPTLSVSIVAVGAALDGSAVGPLAPWWRASFSRRIRRAPERAAGRDESQRAIADADAER